MTDPTANCLFCRILRGEIPAKKVYEDEHVFAFEDIDPKAPTHVLIIPRKHFAGLKEAQAEDAEVIGQCHLAAAKIAHRGERGSGRGAVCVSSPRPSLGWASAELASGIETVLSFQTRQACRDRPVRFPTRRFSDPQSGFRLRNDLRRTPQL